MNNYNDLHGHEDDSKEEFDAIFSFLPDEDQICPDCKSHNILACEAQKVSYGDDYEDNLWNCNHCGSQFEEPKKTNQNNGEILY